MKEINLWEFYIEDGSNYGTVHGRYSSIEMLKEKILKSEHLRTKLNNGYWIIFSGSEYNICGENSKLKIEITKETATSATACLWVEEGYVERYREEITPEVKEPGVPYEPEKIIKRFDGKIPFSRSANNLTIFIEKTKIKIDGIPTAYGEMEEQE